MPQEVEPMCKESDHIHIIALAQALSVSSWVEGMDRGKGSTMPLEGSSPRSAFSAGLDTKTPSTNRAALLSARH